VECELIVFYEAYFEIRAAVHRSIARQEDYSNIERSGEEVFCVTCIGSIGHLEKIHSAMIKKLKDSGRLNITLLLTLMSLFCFFLSILRFYFSETKVFLFLNWNLFLAMIPWAASTMMLVNKNYRSNKVALLILLLTWLLFFPNAPYILTDLFHLHQRASVPMWFDLVVILSFAWTGLAFGFISLFDIETLLSTYFQKRIVRIFTITFLFVGSFGIYLGRYRRWNSWDILSDPSQLLAEIGNRFIDPFSHPRTWGVTLFMGILLNMMFLTFKLFASNQRLTLDGNKFHVKE
jgi:uncharacterized membrane protein